MGRRWECYTIHGILSNAYLAGQCIPGGIGINLAEGEGIDIEHMGINNGKIFIKSPQKMRVDFIPARTMLLLVTNR